jgi:uncharacterized protein
MNAPNDVSLDESPYHAGEQALQIRAGVRERSERMGRMMIRDHLPEQHRAFFAQLPFVLVGALDAHGRPRASLVAGPPGFASAPDQHTLRLDAHPAEGDPIAEGLGLGAPVGLLGIQLETRRRNRMNGIVSAVDERGFRVRVAQSFGNCPQYIQARDRGGKSGGSEGEQGRGNGGGNGGAGATLPLRREGARLSAAAAALVGAADTFFIASAAPLARSGKASEGVDVSHRGGKPGFVRLDLARGGEATTLTVPDFPGNGAFNTLGNLALDARAGLLFVDFASGDLLSLVGEAEIIWEGPELASFARAERLLRIQIGEGVWLPGAAPRGWSAPRPAPQLAATGSW